MSQKKEVKSQLRDIPQHSNFSLPDFPEIEMTLVNIGVQQRGYTYKCRFIDPLLDKFFKTITLTGREVVMLKENSVPPEESLDQQ